MAAGSTSQSHAGSADAPPARTGIVTGAGKGLGAAFAMAIGAAGANIVVNNRRRAGDDPPSADCVVAELGREGIRAVADYCDVADAGAADRLVRAAVDNFGGLDAVICNAGVSGEAMLFEKTAPESFADIMAINFTANVRLVSAALPYLKQSSAGRVVFVSSSAGLHGARGLAAYAASKGALNAFALTLADELRRYEIGVNILCPFASTQMTAGSVDGPHQHLLDPHYVAPAAAWLAGPDCAETGATWVACAGRIRRARLFESKPFGSDRLEDLDAAWFNRCAARGFDLGGARGFGGAQEAFADIFADAARRAGGDA